VVVGEVTDFGGLLEFGVGFRYEAGGERVQREGGDEAVLRERVRRIQGGLVLLLSVLLVLLAMVVAIVLVVAVVVVIIAVVVIVKLTILLIWVMLLTMMLLLLVVLLMVVVSLLVVITTGISTCSSLLVTELLVLQMVRIA
jgi:uncharacterized membrane protein